VKPILDNVHVDEYKQDVCHFQAFEHNELLLGVDVMFQNYSLMENDIGSLQIMARHSESLTGNI
jgi:hypothetical protein